MIKVNLPVTSCMNFVKIFPALLTEVFVRRHLGAEDANTSAMLPDFANVALNEEASNILCEFNAAKKVRIPALHGRATRVFLSVADASDGLVLVILEVLGAIGHFESFRTRRLVNCVFLAARTSAGQ